MKKVKLPRKRKKVLVKFLFKELPYTNYSEVQKQAQYYFNQSLEAYERRGRLTLKPKPDIHLIVKGPRLIRF